MTAHLGDGARSGGWLNRLEKRQPTRQPGLAHAAIDAQHDSMGHEAAAHGLEHARRLGGVGRAPDHHLDRLGEQEVEGLEHLLKGIEAGEVEVVTRELTQPSPLALEVLTARPYAYLDDAPLEERRTQAVMARRWLAPEEASDLGRLDPEAIARVKAEIWPDAANADELHDALVWLGFLTETEVNRQEGWRGWLAWIYAHIFSFANWANLASRMGSPAAGAGDKR